MRCENCERFVPYNTEEEPEAELEVSDEGQLTGSVRRVLTCEECGSEMKETTFDIDADLKDILKMDLEAGLPCGESHEWDWENAEEPETSADMRVETNDKNGKPIKSSRYMKTYYGVVITGSVKCQKCGIEATWEVKDECAASGMDELM